MNSSRILLIHLMIISRLISISSPEIIPLSELVDKAGAIITGKIHRIRADVITLKKTNFLKGCGPRTVAIRLPKIFSDFQFKLPIVGTSVVVFVCQASLNRRWWTLGVGQVSKEGPFVAIENLPEIQMILDKKGICSNCCSFLKKCPLQNRSESKWSSEFHQVEMVHPVNADHQSQAQSI